MIAREGERPVKKLGILTLIVLANGCASTRPEAIRSPLAIADPRAGQENNAGSGIDADIADAVVGGGVTGEAQTLNRIADETVRLANAVVQETVRPETPPEASKANGELPDGKSELPGSEPVVRAEPIPAPLLGEPTTDAPARSGDTVVLDSVIDSVYRSYPLLDAAIQDRTIAAGEQLAALGGFDLSLKGASENGPTGFYETYRQRLGVTQPRFEGGEYFAGYRVGRGNFQPWYKERETNEAGEFTAGMAVPLARDRRIDPRRAELWRANAGRQMADPNINAQLIGFVQEAGYSYWNWVAAGEKLRIANGILLIAEDRTERIRRQVEEDLLDPPVLTDNLRLVADRRAAKAAAERRLRQAAVKLSLYYRDDQRRPLIPGDNRLPAFPDPTPIDAQAVAGDISNALRQRPEITVLTLMQRQFEIDFNQARNEYQPSIDAVVAGSQDVGTPASSSNDKGQFELDAALYLDLPVQRRKARGKMQSTQGKLIQLEAKRRLVEDKIVADVQSVYAALLAAYEQVVQAKEAVGFAEDLAQRERRNLALGASDLLTVALREQFAVEAADKAVDSLLLYYLAQADYRAALAEDQLP
jgi:outer membrane protein TolC